MIPNQGYAILDAAKVVVTTQRAVKSELRMAERLIPIDGPIILYRRRRQELIDAAECAEIDKTHASERTG